MPRATLIEHFGHAGPYFLPVIHTEGNITRTLISIERALSAKADGIWLISHSMSTPLFLDHAQRLAGVYHDKTWIGINCLGLPAYDVPASLYRYGFRVNQKMMVRGIWADEGYVNDTGPVTGARLTRASMLGYNGLHFGGVAFKTQNEVRDPRAVAAIATDFMDVITTSGITTGVAPDVEKISLMREGCGGVAGHPLAIPSGITPENVGPFLSLADVFMVASGISEAWDLLDAAKTSALASAIRAARH